MEMLKECACAAVIVGHSERRHVFGETDELIQNKVNAGVTGGLQVIFCIGETGAEREAGQTSEVINRQLEQGLSEISKEHCHRLTIAYEPVWAIGTEVTATPEQAEESHSDIRQWMGSRFGEPVARAVRIIYGGSVKPENSAELLSKVEIDGLLVGSAQLGPGFVLCYHPKPSITFFLNGFYDHPDHRIAYHCRFIFDSCRASSAG